MRVLRFDQVDLPIALPTLYLALTDQRAFESLVRFKPHETIDTVFFRESRNSSRLVFPDTSREIVGRTDVERSVMPTRDDIDEERHAGGRMGPGLRRDLFW